MRKIIIFILIIMSCLHLCSNIIFDEDDDYSLWDTERADSTDAQAAPDNLYDITGEHSFSEAGRNLILRNHGFRDGKNHDLLGKPYYYLPLFTTTLVTAVAISVDIDAFSCIIPAAGCLASSLIFGTLNGRHEFDAKIHDKYEEGYRSGLRQKSYQDAFVKSTAGCCLGTLLAGFLFGIL